MAAAPGGVKPSTASYEERRWVVIGVCLNKVLTPALRKVLANEIPKRHQILLNPPHEIDKQTYAKHLKTIPPSTLKLNYDSINNNSAHRTPKAYDYSVKDPLSLAKLFMKPFMANFTGFDETMDASAVLSIMCESQPFISSGADAIAKKVRSDIRNKWAHCKFSHWTGPNFQNAIQSMQSLAKTARMTPAEEKDLVDELESWKNNGLKLCFGQAVDPELLKLVKTQVSGLKEDVKQSKEDKESQDLLLQNLTAVSDKLESDVEIVKQAVKDLAVRQDDLRIMYTSSCHDIVLIQNQLTELTNMTSGDIPYVYWAPEPNPWFTGRQVEFQKLESLLKEKSGNQEKKVTLAAVCGLGGCGKTSLVAEYAQRKKDHYQGGVFWFSAEDNTKLEKSVNEVAISIGTFLHDSFDVTLSKTLTRISGIDNPWLIVLDDMDELDISQNVLKIISGPWQQSASGHLVITTRRKPSALANDIRGLQESGCIRLECFKPAEAKSFLYSRTGLPRDEQTDPVVDDLVKELGGLPLALEQAGAYIKSLPCSFFSYLESYKVKRLYLLNKRKGNPTSMYESKERLAVETTWLLNFEHIKQNTEGKHALRFLNACAFLNPNEIAKELLNVGKPLVEDEQYREFVRSPLSSAEVFNMLTEFSLFKTSQEGCLSVHRLVQEVVQENLKPDAKAESFVDAVRMLLYAFSQCPSPDDLLSSVNDQRERGNTIDSTNPSLFYRWSKLCLHSHEMKKNVERFLEHSAKDSVKTIFLPETARVVYECALHFSVNSKSNEAKQTVDLAYRVVDWTSSEISAEKFKALFPHVLPFPELVRRHILYSCKSPATFERADIKSTPVPLVSCESTEVEEMRLEGNRLFKEGLFAKAVGKYSRAIEMSKGSNVFDPRLLTDRASSYLRLEQYDNAMKDAEEYILLCPDCWKGYARKALALNGSSDDLNAKCFAGLAFFRNRAVFREYKPFKLVFEGLEKCISVCCSTPQLVAALESVSCWRPTGMGEIKNIVLLEPGNYVISSASLNILVVDLLRITGCILCGIKGKSAESRVNLKFSEKCSLNLVDTCAVYNLDFDFDQGFCYSMPCSFATFFNCSFTCKNDEFSVLQPLGRVVVDSCRFRNCKAGGFLICQQGVGEIRNSVCSGNRMHGLEVRDEGSLTVINCNVYDNMNGLFIGPGSSRCSVMNSQLHDNRKSGVSLYDNGCGNVLISGNRIFHNDYCGISVDDSSAVVQENKVFDNCVWGIWTQSNSWCRISGNEVFRNKTGGVRLGLRDGGPEFEPTIVEHNKIFDNKGPGIDENAANFDIRSMKTRTGWPIGSNPLQYDHTNSIPGLKKAKCEGNEMNNNRELAEPKSGTLASPLKLCSFCQKRGDLKKCTKCFMAGYCGRHCQKQHWKRHRRMCPLYLKQSSVLVDLSLSSSGGRTKSTICLNLHHPDLEPVGPKYCQPPQQNGKRFVVKVQTGDPVTSKPNEVVVYDRSMFFHGRSLSAQLFDMVREYGSLCQRKYFEKKVFLWALFCENDMLRIFTNEVAPTQRW